MEKHQNNEKFITAAFLEDLGGVKKILRSEKDPKVWIFEDKGGQRIFVDRDWVFSAILKHGYQFYKN